MDIQCVCSVPVASGKWYNHCYRPIKCTDGLFRWQRCFPAISGPFDSMYDANQGALLYEEKSIPWFENDVEGDLVSELEIGACVEAARANGMSGRVSFTFSAGGITNLNEAV